MKKAISYLIALMMVFTTMPYVAFADNVNDNTTGETGSLVLYVEQQNELFTEGDLEQTIEVIEVEPLSDSDEDIVPNSSSKTEYAETVEEAGLALRAGMVERQSSIVINTRIDELTEEAMLTKADQIFNEAINHTGDPKEGDSLKWVWDNCSYGISGTSDGTNCFATITYNISYYTTADEETALTNAVDSLKQELDLTEKTDYEIIKAIYDYMVANISYDYTNLDNDSHKLKYTAYAALVNKTSVCQGYATLFYRMALEYGIDVRVIAGESLNNKGDPERHAWNIVKLGDKYYNLDATWDSTWDSDKTTHDFLLQGSDSFENHICDTEFTTDEFNSEYPISKTDYEAGLESEEPDDNTDTDGTIAQGTCGDNITWALNKDGVFVLAGEGEVLIDSSALVPWEEYKNQIKQVDISQGITNIGFYAFYGCADLEAVNFPSSIIKIDGSAFEGCSNLKSITLPQNVTIIGTNAFSGCNSLETLTIPANVLDISIEIVKDCENLEHVLLECDPPEELCNSFSGYYGIVYYPCENKNYESNLSTIKAWMGPTADWRPVHKYITHERKEPTCGFGWSEYQTCAYCDYTTFEADLYPITDEHDMGEWIHEEYATESKEGLYKRNCTVCGIEESWEYSFSRIPYEVENGYIYFDANSNCIVDCDDSITKAEIPNEIEGHKVIGIGEQAFKDANGLTVVKLPNSMVSIGKEAFLQCYSLIRIAIPKSVTSIADDAFLDCSWFVFYGEENSPAAEYVKKHSEEQTVVFVAGEMPDILEFKDIDYCTIKTIPPQKYEGISVTPNVIIEDGNKILKENVDYILQYENNNGPGLAQVYIVGIGGYKSYSCVHFNIQDPHIHIWSNDYTVDKEATCTEEGSKSIHCLECEAVKDAVVIKKLKHSFGIYKTTTKAEFGKNGVQTATCKVCKEKTTKSIAAPKTIKLSYDSCTYNGKTKKPTVTVYDRNNKKISSKNYTVSYSSGRKNVGRYKVTVTMKSSSNDYKKSSKYTTFKINPKGTSISKLSKGKKSFIVKWKKQSGKMAKSRITGYQYRYSTSSKMTNAKIKTVKGYSKTSAKKTGLKAKKNYYVQVRTYKTVKGVKYYSSWSKYKKVKTK